MQFYFRLHEDLGKNPVTIRAIKPRLRGKFAMEMLIPPLPDRSDRIEMSDPG